MKRIPRPRAARSRAARSRAACSRAGTLKVACVVVAAGSVAGCQFTGFGSMPLPFTPGTGTGSYAVTAQLANVTSLPPHAEVMVNEAAVGTVTAIRFDHWHADVTISLPASVRLPANATATIGQTSILGAKYVALAPPASPAKPAGELRDGDVIPLSRTSTYPSTEDVLAALSTVLNGGGLNQLATITRELNAALGGHTAQVRDLLANLSTLAGTLNAQRGSIVASIASLNDLAAKIKSHDATLAGALDTIPAGLAVLNSSEGNLTQALAAVSSLSTVANQVINSSQRNLLANLRHLRPVLAKLADSGKNISGSLNILPTVPFPVDAVRKGIVGDYGNLYLTLNLTLPDLEKAWLTGTPLSGITGDKPSAPASNPLTAPLKLPRLIPNGSGSGSAGGATPGGSSGSGSGSGGVGGILGGLIGGSG